MSSPTADAFPPLQETLVEFRAGKMLMDGKRVIPDSRKGLVRIGRGEEGLVHFQWLDRTNNVVEDDQIIFPDEGVFEKVDQASGRVYILKFQTDDRKFFFWMQEPKAENDTHMCDLVNFYINRPLELPDEEETDASMHLRNPEDVIEEDISSRGRNLVGPGMDAEVTSDVNSSGPVKLADLQKILSNIGSADDAGDPDAGNVMRIYISIYVFSQPRYGVISRQMLYRVGFGLGDILKPELISPLIETLSLEQGLASYLPEGQWTPEDLMEILQSPPFRQQVDSFTYVLRTGQIDLTQFGIDPSKYKFTVLSFLEALEDSVSNASELESTSNDEKGSTTQTCNKNDPMDEGH